MIRPDVIIPLYRPDQRFDKILKMLFSQTVRPAKLILLNTEADGYSINDLKERVEKAAAKYETTGQLLMEVRLISVKKEAFDHGGTRNLGIEQESTSEFFLCMTQDAVPSDIFLLERLLRCFQDPQVGACYARQIPSERASFREKYLRLTNYETESRKKTKADESELSVKTYLLSNVCAMYRRSSYDALGGFVRNTIFNEDMIFGAKLINDGQAIFYCANAKVFHTHSYSYSEQFRRSFDLAVSQADYKEIFESVSSEKTGLHFVKGAADYCLSQRKYFELASFLTEAAFRYVGFFLGKHYKMLPMSVVHACTLQPAYWEKKEKAEQNEETKEASACDDDPLSELHLLEKKALKALIEFLQEKNLSYYAIGGTLLGAVRHGGFIPWDDDIDLAMPRKDYDRLVEMMISGEAAKSLPSEFSLSGWQTDDSFKSYFIKLSSNEVEIHERLLSDTTVRKGYLIDILPMDGAPDKETERKLYYAKAMWYRFLCGTANVTTGIRTSRPKWEQLVLKIGKALQLYRFLRVEKIYKKMDRLFRAQPQSSEYAGTLTGAYKLKEMVPRAYFGDTEEEFCEKPFEGLLLRCPVHYDRYLTHMFGDYEKLPPKKDRKVHYKPELIPCGREVKE